VALRRAEARRMASKARKARAAAKIAQSPLPRTD
jgi:hypothetical protein